MTPTEHLIAARALIARPENWTKHTAARDSHGQVVYSDNPRAVCWCTIGALAKTAKGRDPLAANDLIFLQIRENPDIEEDSIDGYNDAPETTHANILALFDKAIAAASKEGN